jgi:hypothetical protein
LQFYVYLFCSSPSGVEINCGLRIGHSQTPSCGGPPSAFREPKTNYCIYVNVLLYAVFIFAFHICVFLRDNVHVSSSCSYWFNWTLVYSQAVIVLTDVYTCSSLCSEKYMESFGRKPLKTGTTWKS